MKLGEALEKLDEVKKNIKDNILANSGESYSCTSSCQSRPKILA